MKLFFPGKEDYFQRELQYHTVVEQMELPVMQLDQIIKIEDRPGLIFRGAVIGQTIGQIIKRAPWRVIEMAHLLADIHPRIHQNHAVGLPTFKSKLKIQHELDYELPPSVRSSLLMLIDQLPDDNALCHGDFHMENVIVSKNRYLIIDWNWCSQGSVICDVCKTIACLRFENYDLPFLYRKIQRPIRHLLAKEYLLNYIERTGLCKSSIIENYYVIEASFKLKLGSKTRERAIKDLGTRQV